MSDQNPIRDYPGKEATVYWDKRLCIHIGECGRATCELFESGRDPWCQPDTVNIDEVVDVVERCPTGAIHYTRHDGGDAESAPGTNTVFVANNGPLYLHGELTVDGATEDMAGTRFRAALCRCGESKNKPFCDNTHESAGFVDRGAVGDAGTPLSETGGPVNVNRIADGPLYLTGNITILTGNGRVGWQGEKVALCRCGASKNKPFCDGAHKDAGFKAD